MNAITFSSIIELLQQAGQFAINHSDEFFERKFISLNVRSSFGNFYEITSIAAPNYIVRMIGETIESAVRLCPDFHFDVKYFYLGDELPCVPCAPFGIFAEDFVDFCRRHH